MNSKSETVGRQNFMKILAFSGLSAAACRLPSLLVENYRGTLSFETELEGATVEMDWNILENMTDLYNISKQNLRDFSVIVTNDRVNPGNFMGNAWHVSTTCSEASSGKIAVAGRAIMEEVESRIRDHLRYDAEYVRHVLPSQLLSHAVFLGFAQLADARGLFLPGTPLALAELYYNQMANGGESQPFVDATVTL